MKELSLNILDIAQNSIRARAKLVKITLHENAESLEITVSDDGCGMKADFLKRVTDPFSTTRTTRSVGLGLPFFKMEAEMTGGTMTIDSRSEEEYNDHGTVVTARFFKNHIDYIPLGNIIDTVCTLIHGAENVDFLFSHSYEDAVISLSTREMREMLGEDIPLSSPEVLAWVRDYLTESYTALYGNSSDT